MSIYHLKDGIWEDYVEQQEGIKTLISGEWVDGADNQYAPPISLHIYNNGKFLQKYPNAQITYTDTFKASDLKFTHTSSSSWGTDTSRGDAKAGIWESGAIYTGWLGLTPSMTVSAGRGNVADIINVNVKYNRRGVGNWEIEYPLALVLSNLKSANVGGYTAHHTSKKLKTFYSDDKMLTCSGTSAERVGTTTMNNNNAKAMLKEWMNRTDYSILLGYKESSNTPFIGLYGLELEITYTSNLTRAIIPDVPMAYNVERNNSGNVEMWLYDNELDLSFTEIIKRRELLGIKMINDKDVIIGRL